MYKYMLQSALISTKFKYLVQKFTLFFFALFADHT